MREKWLFWVIFGIGFILLFFIVISRVFDVDFLARWLAVPDQLGPFSEPDLEQEALLQDNEAAQISIIAQDLEVPWGIVFLPDDSSILLTEKPGRVRLVSDGNLEPEPIAVFDVETTGEGGLLGIALHPDFANNNHVYLYYTYRGNNSQILNRVVRMTYQNNQLQNEQIIIDNIPGATNHNGGRIKFGPDGYLYVAVGDAGNSSLAQDLGSLAGKILRVTDEGKAPLDNPFGNLVYSYGHRNPQGLAWDDEGQLWATEHGRSGVLSGLDELNLIEGGNNYGWPLIQGDKEQKNMKTPVIHSGPSITWAPAGLTFWHGSLFFGGLRGQTLYETLIGGEEVALREHFQEEFGRIREVILGPDDFLYVSTSNRDGRGNPLLGDDKIIKINFKSFD